MEDHGVGVMTMPTDALYALDSSIKEFNTHVLEVQGDEVALAATAFYPGGGGQPNDLGTLFCDDRTWKVTGVRKDGDLIWHRLEGDPLPKQGDAVWGLLDWDRRYLLMRTHTALHILSAIAYRDHGATVTGGNMEPGEGRLDFEIAEFSPAVAEAMVPKTNLIPPEVKRIRIVEIVGLDRQADGGTHVASTAEVGQISLRGTRSKGASNKRIMIGLEP